MRNFRKLAALAAILALSAIGVANASAATFTASSTGSLTGKATSSQEFTVNAGTVRCNTAETVGTIFSTASTEQHATVVYKGCVAFAGGLPAHITPATYLFTANGEVHIKETITIEVTGPFFFDCHITIGPQTVKSVVYSNSGTNMKVAPNIGGIAYTTSGLYTGCGSGGGNGTYKGTNEFSRVGGGSISWDK